MLCDVEKLRNTLFEAPVSSQLDVTIVDKVNADGASKLIELLKSREIFSVQFSFDQESNFWLLLKISIH